jgi:hypothetical protein
MIEGWAHPLCLLDDPAAYKRWQDEVGSDEALSQMNAACREHMRIHGVRSILEVVEKMDDASAIMGEFVTEPLD